MYIGCVECIPRAFASDSDVKSKVLSLCMYLLGAICIGLVLFGHEHCAAEGGGHEGHGH